MIIFKSSRVHRSIVFGEAALRGLSAVAAYAARGMELFGSMGLRPRLSADAAFAAYSNPGLAPGDYSMNPVPLGKVFVFSILQRFFGEPSGYRLRWACLGLLGIGSMGLRPRLSADAAFAAYSNPGLAPGGILSLLGKCLSLASCSAFLGNPQGTDCAGRAWACLGSVPWAYAHG